MKQHSLSAFTLIEIAIVLVVIGLLVGGVMGGKSLIRSSELRSVITQKEEIFRAVRQFEEKYEELPGDMPNATAFWGAADGNDGIGADCRSATENNNITTTCNGDGDGEIEHVTTATIREQFTFWKHLEFAGLLNYGMRGGSNTAAGNQWEGIVGVNVPRAKIAGNSLGFCTTWQGGYGQTTNMLIIGNMGWTTVPCYHGYASSLRNSEVFNLDKKYDDGNPGKGIMRATGSENLGFNSCESGGHPWITTTATYLVNGTGGCRMHFIYKN